MRPLVITAFSSPTVRYFTDMAGTVPAKPGDLAVTMLGPSGRWYSASGIGVIGEDGALIDGRTRGEWTPARLVERPK